MTDPTVALSHLVELPRSIVWDALVDPDLVAGWLGEARIDPRVGGAFDLAWVAIVDSAPLSGRITVFDEPARFAVESDTFGLLEFALEEVAGGSRGTSTVITLEITAPIEPAFVPRATERWQLALAQLSDLVRGHPVLWRRDEGVADAALSPEHASDRASDEAELTVAALPGKLPGRLAHDHQGLGTPDDSSHPHRPRSR
ncbi:SRPBCC domain-containing protein [Marisediminicola sp. LYQ134]|uniref:SRPBCC domain-containing protein n=1 Tax=Marisediminicola sp. LYQ134 TaxID=3391061 RepID=UPI003983C51F